LERLPSRYGSLRFCGANAPDWDKTWGVRRRVIVPEDAGVFHPGWGHPRIYFSLRKTYSESRIRKENAMNGSMIILLLFVIRLVIPITLTLLVGEWMRRQESIYWLK
jgi:hypothetical protein